MITQVRHVRQKLCTKFTDEDAVPEARLDQPRQRWRTTQGLLLLSSTTSMLMAIPQTTSVAKVPSHWDILVPGTVDPPMGYCAQAHLRVSSVHSGTCGWDSPTQTA